MGSGKKADRTNPYGTVVILISHPPPHVASNPHRTGRNGIGRCRHGVEVAGNIRALPAPSVHSAMVALPDDMLTVCAGVTPLVTCTPATVRTMSRNSSASSRRSVRKFPLFMEMTAESLWPALAAAYTVSGVAAVRIGTPFSRYHAVIVVTSAFAPAASPVALSMRDGRHR